MPTEERKATSRANGGLLVLEGDTLSVGVSAAIAASPGAHESAPQSQARRETDPKQTV